MDVYINQAPEVVKSIFIILIKTGLLSGQSDVLNTQLNKMTYPFKVTAHS